MTESPLPAEAIPAAEAEFDDTGVKRELTGSAWKLVAGVALAFSTYQLIIAAFSPLSSLPTRSLHVGFLLLLSFLIYPIGKRANRHKIAWFDLVLAALARHCRYTIWFSKRNSYSVPATRRSSIWRSGPS